MRTGLIAFTVLCCLAGCAGTGGAPPSPGARTEALPAAALYYVDFRARLSAEDIPGHTYLAYGMQDAAGRSLEEHIAGFYPIFGPLGMLIGSVVFPGKVGDGFVQDYMPLLDSYRLTVTAAQYERLSRFVAEQKSQPHIYSLLGHNCNDWAAEAAAVIGLRVPLLRAVPPDLFVKELRAANT